MDARAGTGRWGERAAARYLIRRGWTVIATRWRGGGGEIDLAATRRGVVAVCEVKVRRTTGLGGNPVRVAQRERMRRAALALVAERPALRGHVVRLDLIVVRQRGPFARVRHRVGALERA